MQGLALQELLHGAVYMAHPLEVRGPNLDVNAKVQKEQQQTEAQPNGA